MFKAVEAPLRTIVENAGGEGSVVIAKVLDGRSSTGYNAKTEQYVDMFRAGIIDPKKVTRVALENAASVAGMILTTECSLVDIRVPTLSFVFYKIFARWLIVVSLIVILMIVAALVFRAGFGAVFFAILGISILYVIFWFAVVWLINSSQ